MILTAKQRRISRALGALILGLLLLWGLAAYGVGLAAEQRLQRLAASDAKQGWKIELLEYQRGFFSSRAVTLLRPAGGRQAGWHLAHRIRHGPLPAPGLLTGGKNPGDLLLLARISSKRHNPEQDDQAHSNLRVDTTINLAGEATTSWHWPSPNPPGTTPPAVGWQQLSGRLSYPLDFSRLRGELAVNSLTLQNPSLPLLAAQELNTTFAWQQQRTAGGEATLAGEQLLRADGLQLDENHYPEVLLAGNWQHLDRQALEQLATLLPWLTATLPRRHQQVPPPAAETLVEALPRLLRHSPRLEVEQARLTTPAGVARAGLRLAYQQRPDDERPFHPLMLLSGLDFKLSASLPAAILPGGEQSRTLAEMRRRGYLEEAGPGEDKQEQLEIEIGYSQGELLINDHPAPLQILLNLLR